jgi:hypothetical protein
MRNVFEILTCNFSRAILERKATALKAKAKSEDAEMVDVRFHDYEPVYYMLILLIVICVVATTPFLLYSFCHALTDNQKQSMYLCAERTTCGA